MFNKDSIIKALDSKKWSRYKLCKEASIAQSTLSDILSGESKNPNTKTLQKIADALEVSMSTFFDGDDAPVESTEVNIPEDYLEKYTVTSRDKKQYIDHMKKATEAFFMNDEFDEEDKKEILDTMSELFWRAKEKNKRKPKSE